MPLTLPGCSSPRVLGGFAVGAASVMSPAYIAEVASARYRGRLATVQQMAIICGLFAAFLSNYLLARAAGASTEPLWLGHEAGAGCSGCRRCHRGCSCCCCW